jgi:hypothetical protein
VETNLTGAEQSMLNEVATTQGPWHHNASLVATWLHDEIADTDRNVEAVSLLAAVPAAQEVVVTRLTNLIATRLDVEEVTQQALDAIAVATAATSGGEHPVLVVDPLGKRCGEPYREGLSPVSVTLAAVIDAVEYRLARFEFARASRTSDRRSRNGAAQLDRAAAHEVMYVRHGAVKGVPITACGSSHAQREALEARRPPTITSFWIRPQRFDAASHG